MSKRTSSSLNLRQLRQRIDTLDRELLAVLNSRAEVVQQIAQLKTHRAAPYYSPARERRLLEALRAHNPGPLPNELLTDIIRSVLKASLALEKKLRVAYLGPSATFTHLAAIHTFGRHVDFSPAHSIPEIFRLVEKHQADYGVVPVENSTEGAVNHTLDMFLDSELKIYSEVVLEISHCLLGKGKLDQITRVYSHPQALAQCREWLETHLPGATVKQVESTARAAQRARRERGAGAVASEIAASLYRLTILAEHIEDASSNYTRFLVIAPQFAEPSGQDKTSILFSIKDRVGALSDMLAPFRRHAINLTKIESRPTKKRAWEYVFFLDFLGHRDDPNVKRALAELTQQCLFLKILGSYPRSEEQA